MAFKLKVAAKRKGSRESLGYRMGFGASQRLDGLGAATWKVLWRYVGWTLAMVISCHLAAVIAAMFVFRERPWLWETSDFSLYFLIVTLVGVAKGIDVARE